MEDLVSEVPGFVGVDENCSYGVSRTAIMKSKKMFEVRCMKSNGGLVQFRAHGITSQRLISKGRFLTVAFPQITTLADQQN